MAKDAHFRFEVKIIGRPRSVVNCAAYRGGYRLYDERQETLRNYSARRKSIALAEIRAADTVPAWVRDPQTLFNVIEATEDESNKHETAQLCREILPCVPVQLSEEGQIAALRKWTDEQLVSRGMVCLLSLHRSARNPHAHILCTMRELDDGQFKDTKNRDWNSVGLLRQWRESWAKAVNDALAAEGRPERVDHRSLKDKGIDRLPQPKIGVAAAAMEKRGILTERGRLAEVAAMTNSMLPHMRDIERYGEVRQYGVGDTWWERSLAALGQEEAHAPSSGGAGVADPPAPGAVSGWQGYVSGRRAEDTEPQR